ncbi:DUF3772 domain-containing protein [Gluconobacter morbifer]|nr:DUF3772 domain-containing protein [Gluconobacter morbifer]
MVEDNARQEIPRLKPHGRTTLTSLVLALLCLACVLPTGFVPPVSGAPASHDAASSRSPAPDKNAAPKDTSSKNAATPDNLSQGLGWNAISQTVSQQLDDSATSLRRIFNSLNRTDPAMGASQLDALAGEAQRIQQNTRNTIQQIESYDGIIDSYLKILGPKAADNEDPSVTKQRQRMQANSQSVKSALMRAKLYNLQAQQLGTAISTRQNRLQQAALSERSVSPLAPRFWQTLVTEHAENRSSVHSGGILQDWMWILGGTVLSLLSVGFGSPLLLAFIKRSGAHLHRSDDESIQTVISGSVIAITLNGLLCAILATLVWFIWAGITLPDGGDAVGTVIAETLPLCGFIIGAGLPVFGRQGVLAATSPNVRKCVRGMDWALALGILALNVLRTFRTQGVFGPTLQNLLEIVFALGVAFCAVDTFRRLGKQNETERFAAPAFGMSSLLLVVTVFSIMLGYVAFAFTLNGWFLSLGSGLAIVALLGLCWRNLLDRMFDEHGFVSRHLYPLGISQRRLTQVSVLLSGTGNIILLLVLFSVAQTDGSFNIADITNRFWLLFVGNTVHGVKISLDTVVMCIVLAVASSYAIRQSRAWIQDRFLPTTRLDIGSRTSILSIFTYCAWILVGLAILSLAGVSVQNLTWVVSALSVGIGFGLQSIVQNFVSGVILLAERPVRVGDMVEIAGTRGDIKRISIRATDISLADGSTMIVPNSQFITSSVKNATLSGATGALTVSFLVPTSTDLDKARNMLLEVAAHRQEVLSSPPPRVRVSALSGDSVTMSLSVTLVSARDASSVQDAILFDVFRRFHSENVTITTA